MCVEDGNSRKPVPFGAFPRFLRTFVTDVTFESLGVAEPILRALSAENYTKPTPIQTRAIPALLSGRDLLGIAQTGTGKTAAFMLPSIDRLRASQRRAGHPVARRHERMLSLRVFFH